MIEDTKKAPTLKVAAYFVYLKRVLTSLFDHEP